MGIGAGQPEVMASVKGVEVGEIIREIFNGRTLSPGDTYQLGGVRIIAFVYVRSVTGGLQITQMTFIYGLKSIIPSNMNG